MQESTKLGDLAHCAQVRLANLRRSSQGLNHRNGLLHGLGIRAGDVYFAGVLGVDRATGSRDDVLDHLSARTDHILDVLGANLNGGDSRSVRADLWARLSQGLAYISRIVPSYEPSLCYLPLHR